VKIIDFGLARVHSADVDTRVLFGTPEFMAPEVVQYEPIHFATDTWSIGVIAYVLYAPPASTCSVHRHRAQTAYTTTWRRRGVVVSGVRRMNEVNARK